MCSFFLVIHFEVYLSSSPPSAEKKKKEDKKEKKRIWSIEYTALAVLSRPKSESVTDGQMVMKIETSQRCLNMLPRAFKKSGERSTVE